MPVAAPAPADGNAAASLPVHVDTARPDLSVIITAPVNDGIHYQCAVETERVPRHRHRAMNDWALPQQASTLVQQQLSAVFAGGQSAKQRQRALLEAGYEFWNAAPPPMRDALWAMIDAHRPPRSIYIASAEPSLPWELMIPFRQKRSNSELRPLGVEFAIGRWCRGDAVSPPQRIPVRNSFVIAPRYEAERKLDAGEEIRLVRTELSGRRVMASSIDGLDQYFNKNSASLLHFVCHGSSIDGDDVLDLSETETLRSATLRTLGGFKKMCRRRAPFVFLNACSTATINPGLAGGAGFPLAFGDLGARAVLAPLWPVDDSVAGDFAVALYRAALVPGAPPVAEIIRRFRQKAYQKITQDGESAEWTADTWAAYAFFGDPLARLERVGR